MKINVWNEQIQLENPELVIGRIAKPVILEIWNGRQKDSMIRREYPYTRITQTEEGLKACAEIDDEWAGKTEVTDIYRTEEGSVVLSRQVRILRESGYPGIRLRTEISLLPEKKNAFEDLRYFAPPAIYDKNDLDEDGYEDYFHTKKTIFRDDRFNYPMFTCYSEETKEAVSIERDPLPAFDSNPDRKVSEETGEKEALFLQKTDIGSMGADGSDGSTRLTCCYPFYEGDATIALYIVKMVPFGAFWPMKSGEEFSVTYRISNHRYENYHDACWYGIRDIIRKTHPQAEPLSVSPEELIRLRLDALDHYYVEKTAEEDPNLPAGYVLNCHPQDGVQLENIIQYGFTGQNILNAYNVLRYGYEHNNEEYRRKALKTADFFVNTIHIKESGMFYNLYNVDTRSVNFWWTGLLLPLAYAQGEELEKLMGPLYEYRKDVIQKLVSLKGAYLRCMNEDVTALLRLYCYEKEKGTEHPGWLEAIENYAGFLLRTQEQDGGWYRAYDLEGKPLLEPVKWFGNTVYEQKSSTGTSITFLTELYELTKNEAYLESASRAGMFVKEYIIDRVRFNGGVHDSIYAKGQLIDNESILYPMFGMLSLYEATRRKDFLDAAVRAAHYYASWVCLWDVPLPEDSTLHRYGFHSTGMGACDTCGCGYVHPFQLMGVAETAQIAVYAKDKELFDIARLYWLGCNQTVETEERPWGYAMPGLQEEGYLISWWAVDDPMFAADTGFGYRLKGEGNKTCFPWINAVGVKAYWAMKDRFGSVDFEEIENKYF